MSKYFFACFLFISLFGNACGSFSTTAYASCFWDDEEEDYTAYYVAGGIAVIYLLNRANKKANEDSEKNELFHVENIIFDIENGKGIPILMLSDHLTLRALSDKSSGFGSEFNFSENEYFERKNLLSFNYSF